MTFSLLCNFNRHKYLLLHKGQVLTASNHGTRPHRSLIRMRSLFSASEGPLRLFACLISWLATQPSSRAADLTVRKSLVGRSPGWLHPCNVIWTPHPLRAPNPCHFASSSHEGNSSSPLAYSPLVSSLCDHLSQQRLWTQFRKYFTFSTKQYFNFSDT